MDCETNESLLKKGYVLFADFDELDADKVTAYFAEAFAQANLARN